MRSAAPSRADLWPATRVVERGPAGRHEVTHLVLAGPPEATTAVTEALALPLGVHAGAGRPLTVALQDEDLPPQGYRLTVTPGATSVTAVVGAPDEQGRWYGLLALAGLVQPVADGVWGVPEVAVRDWPELEWRGTVEGFYGPPWTHEDRLEHLRFAGRHRLDHYVYAPKDDPFHRDRWRDPYPPADLERFAELAAAADRARVRFVYAISPGLSMRFSDDGDHEALAAKARSLRAVGIREFAILFDDIPTELQHPDDVRAFGGQAGAAGAAHGETCARFARAVPQLERLVMVPTDYAGTTPSPYRTHLARALPPDVLVWWTGRDIVVGAVTREEIAAAAAGYGHDLLLWDNMPVNDFDRSRVFLGPLLGRTGDVAGSGLRGTSANPMVEAAPSHLALATVAEWAWDPASYSSDAAAARALRDVAGPLAEGLAPLVAACSSWPPDAPQSRHLSALVGASLAGDQDARDRLRDELRALAAVPSVLARPGDRRRLAEQLRPWAVAGAATAAAGLAALDLLVALEAQGPTEVGQAGTGPGTGSTEELEGAAERARSALAEAEGYYSNVLRGVIPPFVREVLSRVGGGAAHEEGPLALVVTAAETEPGDASLSEVLAAHGLVVRETAGRHPDTVADGDVRLVVVTRSASPEHALAAAERPAPLVTWAHLVALGLATEAGVLTVRDSVVVSEAAVSLASHVEPDEAAHVPSPGWLTVYRGPGTLTWGEPGGDGVVLARSSDGRPVLLHYPPGSRLADGRITHHGATSLFFGRQGMSPWLVMDAGRALVTATLRSALRGQPTG